MPMNLSDTVKAAVHPRMAADFGTAGQKPSILAKLQRGASQAEAERRCSFMRSDTKFSIPSIPTIREG